MPTHDEICAQAILAIRDTDSDAVISAFVGSLSTRNLPARSAFGSYVVLQHFSHHEYTESEIFSAGNCAYCGLPRSSRHVESHERVDRYPFQVQHTDIQYAAFDLATFGERRVDAPTDDDRLRLHQIFNALRSLPAGAQLTELNKALQGVIKSNKHERMILLETLGYAGILSPKGHLNYATDFVTYDFANSSQPQQFFKREWAYPVRFWTGADGVDDNMIGRYFGVYS